MGESRFTGPARRYGQVLPIERLALELDGESHLSLSDLPFPYEC